MSFSHCNQRNSDRHYKLTGFSLRELRVLRGEILPVGGLTRIPFACSSMDLDILKPF